MLRNLFYVGVLFCLVACKDTNHQETDVRTIEVTDFSGQKQELNELFRTEVLELRSDSSGYVANVKDVAGIGNSVYVLDEVTLSMAKFDRRTGRLEREICQRGNGPLEYIQPVALSSDSCRLYMLDMGGLSVYVYNKELEAERKVWLGFPALDFVRVSDGFLCYNLAVSDTLRQVVYVNDSGKIVDSFGASEVSNSGFAGSKLFSKSGEDDVYCVLPSGRTVYRWDAAAHLLSPYVSYDYGDANYQGDATQAGAVGALDVMPCEFFKVGSSLINSFLYADKRYYACSSPDMAVQKTGMVVDSNGKIPFFPRWQIGDTLIGSCSYEEMDDMSEGEEERYGNMLLLFTLKNE